MKTQNNNKSANVQVKDFCGRPEISFGYKASVSWKIGVEGVKSGRIQREKDGGFYCIFNETSLDGRGSSKEVFVTIPPAAFTEMKKLDPEHAALVTALKKATETIKGEYPSKQWADYGVNEFEALIKTAQV